jgi:leader peptidase (prepilin peptidase)/N-methyltransferase
MDHHAFLIITAFIFAVGACVGSFLNVVIWRLPRNESLSFPPSHCPKCNHQIGAWENIPLLSYLILRGRCHVCKESISLRYPTIELLVSLLFGAVWWRVWSLGLPLGTGILYFYLAASLVAVILIDWEHMIIPNKITYTGMGLALVVAAIRPGAWASNADEGMFGMMVWEGLQQHFPSLVGRMRLLSLSFVFSGLLVGGGFLLLVLEMGKRLYGNLTVKVDEPVEFTMTKRQFSIAGHWDATWEETLSRRSDGFQADVTEVTECQLAEGATGPAPAATAGTLTVTAQTASLEGQSLPLADISCFKGRIKRWRIPREVLGLGDVKLMAMFGALLGAEATIFILLIGSLSGFAVGLFRMVRDRRKAHSALPFGPFLSLGAFVWMFAGPELIRWYGQLLISWTAPVP